MPARPVPEDDDDALVRRAVEGRPPQPRPYEGQLAPGMEGVTGPLPQSRPMPQAGQAAGSAGVPAAPTGQPVVPPQPPSSPCPAAVAADPPPPLPEQLS
eukprot:10938091-Alexandrium_andersonii.AAC.1